MPHRSSAAHKPAGRSRPPNLDPARKAQRHAPTEPERRWSIYGAERTQPTATGGTPIDPDNRSNKPIRSRWQPTATTHNLMVRRGSTVRVRQRALQKRRTSALSRSGRLALCRTCGGYGADYGALTLRRRTFARFGSSPSRAMVAASMVDHAAMAVDEAPRLLAPLRVGDELPWRVSSLGDVPTSCPVVPEIPI
jgi:hypothetical protein